VLDYDGRLFRAADEDGAEAPVARYHQDGDVVWGEFAGGQVRRGSIAGTCGPDGVLHFGYCMVLGDGDVILGRCHSLPDLLDDGRIRLTERWERYGPHAATGISYLEEIPVT
jgi:hypothetical protein